MNLIDEEIDRQKEIVVRMRKLNSEVIAQRDKLAEALRRIADMETIGSPYGIDGLNGAMAHHAVIKHMCERALHSCGLSDLEGK